uniref:Uncharacterized protein n=1 Tax=Tetranychus urticae TaxID=32264 RepID=T1KNW8_TETUR
MISGTQMVLETKPNIWKQSIQS